MEEQARKLGIASRFGKILKTAEKLDAEFNGPIIRVPDDSVSSLLTYNRATGKPENTINNYKTILRNDSKFATLRFNDFTKNAETTVNLKRHIWVDADDSDALDYMQTRYDIMHEPYYAHAFRIICNERSYNPVREMIDGLKWDGKTRVQSFLARWMGCADNEYTREVSRLIFAGGIHRIYEPGYKFDSVAVLIGTHQGEGKSTLIRWLALNDEWYSELIDFDGSKGVESIQGTFVCEIGEMLAMVRAREVEAVRSYISRQTDKYRVPWDKRPALYPRQCIFIGTTNKAQFLTDKTGNRRFLPVEVKMNGYELYKNEIECKQYIRQCWAEAKAMYDTELMTTAWPQDMNTLIAKHQRAALEDDWREDKITEYLDAKKPGESVCIEELWLDALRMSSFDMPTKSESAELSTIMQHFDDWERPADTIRFKKYGSRRGWTKKGDEIPF
jgi:predicted P-loop ATPase